MYRAMSYKEKQILLEYNKHYTYAMYFLVTLSREIVLGYDPKSYPLEWVAASLHVAIAMDIIYHELQQSILVYWVDYMFYS